VKIFFLKSAVIKVLVLTFAIMVFPHIVRAEDITQVNVFVSDNKLSQQVKEILLRQLSLKVQNIPLKIYKITDSPKESHDIHFEKSLNISIGSAAARYLLIQNTEAPIYSVLIPEVAFIMLVEQSDLNRKKYKQGKIAALFIDQPLSRYLSLIDVMGVDIKNIGIFGDKGQFEVDQKHVLKNTGKFNFTYPFLNEMKAPFLSIENILAQTDAIIIRPGKYLNPYISKWILYAAYRKKIPVISFSENFINTGAVASLSSDIQKLGAEAALNITQYLLNNKKIPGNGFSSYYKIKVNQSVTYFLDIKLSDKPVLD